MALPILFVSIGKAYYASLVQSTEKTLEAHLYSIISEVEYSGSDIVMPRNVLAPELNRVDSDTYAMIFRGDERAWQSESALELEYQPPPVIGDAGITDFRLVEYQGVNYWQLSLTGILGNVDHSVEARFIMLKRNEALIRLMDGFRQALIDWLYIMAVAITLLMVFGFAWSARPLQRLDKEIMAIESGDSAQIKGRYPVELQTIKADLNLLLDSQQRQKDRYRASLSDLAHALKTPLAVLQSSELAKDKEAQEQLSRINAIIEHQLKRAASGASDTWKKQTAIAPVLAQITHAMGKVYHDKGINIATNADEKTYFLGDKTDLMELLGNLIDNACKACRGRIDVDVIQNKNTLTIRVADDGPGVPPDKRQALLKRGTRLDSYENGHGVGMAIVADLVAAYHGTLTIADSALGGALFQLEFDYHDIK